MTHSRIGSEKGVLKNLRVIKITKHQQRHTIRKRQGKI